MAVYTIVNTTEALLTDVNVGGVDVDPLSYKDGVTLTDAELVILLNGTTFGAGVIAIHDLTGVTHATQLKRVGGGIASQYVST